MRSLFIQLRNDLRLIIGLPTIKLYLHLHFPATAQMLFYG